MRDDADGHNELDALYIAALVTLCAKKWHKATSLADLYAEQMEEEQQEVSSPRPLMNDGPQARGSIMTKKPKVICSQRVGSYDSTMTAFDAEFQAVEMA